MFRFRLFRNASAHTPASRVSFGVEVIADATGQYQADWQSNWFDAPMIEPVGYAGGIPASVLYLQISGLFVMRRKIQGDCYSC